MNAYKTDVSKRKENVRINAKTHIIQFGENRYVMKFMEILFSTAAVQYSAS